MYKYSRRRFRPVALRLARASVCVHSLLFVFFFVLLSYRRQAWRDLIQLIRFPFASSLYYYKTMHVCLRAWVSVCVAGVSVSVRAAQTWTSICFYCVHIATTRHIHTWLYLMDLIMLILQQINANQCMCESVHSIFIELSCEAGQGENDSRSPLSQRRINQKLFRWN